ncbi:hypothetical protein B0H14DRAFT_2647763 [Mycena olivaceomarginata]|nr:hypothetical protein B0H14DRAFT_2647763 [Mycena olivaceomarginata]
MYSAFGKDIIELWRPEVPDNHNTQISSNCCYFTICCKIPADSWTKFHPRTDPHSGLTHYLSDNTAHCFDNNVMYMVFKGNEYVEKDPGTFKTGDIVEMGFTLITWKKPEAHKVEQTKMRVAKDRGQADNHIPKKHITSTPDSDNEYGVE